MVKLVVVWSMRGCFVYWMRVFMRGKKGRKESVFLLLRGCGSGQRAWEKPVFSVRVA